MPTTKHKIHQRDLIDYKQKHLARKAIADALKERKIKRPEICELCDNTGQLDAHHVDYGRPLFVYWLCDSCHGVVHRKNHPLNPKNNEQTPIALEWKGNESVKIALSIPFENFIFMSKIAQERGLTISKMVRGLILKEYEVEDDQLTFDFNNRRKHDESQQDENKRVFNLEEDEERMRESKSARLQQIRSERSPSLFELDRGLCKILG